MIQGILTITLEPPTLGFSTGRQRPMLRSCSMQELETVLSDLGINNYGQSEFIARVCGTFKEEWLRQLWLMPPNALHGDRKAS
jgi:hypothetical protein